MSRETESGRPQPTQRRNGGLHLAAPLLALGLGAAFWISGCTPQSDEAAPQAGAVTPQEIAAEIIPETGSRTAYGIPLSLDNTQTFIDYYEASSLTPEQEDARRNALLPLKAPCCDDNSMATCCCPCNLAKSVWGLSNYLIVEKGYGEQEARAAALEWLRFIHSDYYVMRELENRGANPAIYGLSYQSPCYTGQCEMPFNEGGCGGMGVLKQ